MKIENNIGWCDATTNAVTGCTRVSEGCRFCYAETGTRARVLRAQGIETWGPKGVRHPVNFEPVFRKLNKLCICDSCHTVHTFDLGQDCGAIPDGCAPLADNECDGERRRIRLFADSNSDWLDERWPIETLARFLDAIRQAPNIYTILLTKRPENWMKRIQMVHGYAWENNNGELGVWIDNWLTAISLSAAPIPDNIWLGVSVEDQKRADERIPELLKIPAAVRFLSVEPLLEQIDLDSALPMVETSQISYGSVPESRDGVDWVIVGGESGDKRRDCGIKAIVSVADQCIASGVPVYVKQASAFKSGQPGNIPDRYWNMKQFPK
jgi:protein gp37